MKQEKMKHLVISEALHEEIKEYCRKNGLILKSFVEKLIKEKLDKNGLSI
jgi:hypothetical protein